MAEVEARAGKKGSLEVDIESTKKEIEATDKSLKEATKIREKEQATHRATDKDLVLGIQNLKNAIIVLKKHQSLIQTDNAMKMAVKSILATSANSHRDLMILKSGMPAYAKAQRMNFLQTGTMTGVEAQMFKILRNPSDNADASEAMAPRFAAQLLSRAAGKDAQQVSFMQFGENGSSKAPASSQIFGILQSMLEDFEGDLKEGREDEEKAGAEFEEMK